MATLFVYHYAWIFEIESEALELFDPFDKESEEEENKDEEHKKNKQKHRVTLFAYDAHLMKGKYNNISLYIPLHHPDILTPPPEQIH